MTTATPQRTVTIRIAGSGQHHQVDYSYVSPTTGQQYQNAPVCDLSIDRATYCLFILDYATTLAGWSITGISNHGSPHTLPNVSGAFNLSYLTYDPYTTDNTYAFYIHYRNALTGCVFCEDPQEGNGPPAPGAA